MIKPLYCYSVAVFLFLHINLFLNTIELKTPIYQTISQMISVSETQFELFMDKSFVRSLVKNEIPLYVVIKLID